MQKQEDLYNYLDLQPADRTQEDSRAPSPTENITQEHPVEDYQEDFEDSDQEVALDTSVKNEETTEAEIYYEPHEDDQSEYIPNYEFAPEDAMTSDPDEFEGSQLYTEEVEEEEMDGTENGEEYHLKIAGEEDEDYSFDNAMDNVILMDDSVFAKPKRKYERQTNSSEKSYKCWIENCGSAFSNRQTMKKHMLHSHSLDVNKSTCMICGDKFDKYPDYLSHVKCHTRKFECKVCKSTFTSFSVLSGHMKRAHSKLDNEMRVFACHVSSITICVKPISLNYYVLDLRRKIQKKRACELSSYLQTLRQERSKVFMQELSVEVLDSSGSQKSRKVS